MTANRATLVIRFESGNLFILAVIRGLESSKQAQQILDSGPVIQIQDGSIYISRPNCELVPLFEEENHSDECGKWLDGADRSSLDDFLDAVLGVPDFLALGPVDYEFEPVWYSISEYSFDDKGQLKDLVASRSGCIGIPALSLRL